MPNTALPTSNRFWEVGTLKLYALATVASATLEPTRAEIDAATTYDMLEDEIASIDGWDTTPGQIDTPDAGTRQMSKIGGRINPADSSLVFYATPTGVDVRSVALFDPDTRLYLMFCSGGDVAASLADVFYVQVLDRQFLHTTDESAGRVRVSFSLLNWVRDVAIPALV